MSKDITVKLKRNVVLDYFNSFITNLNMQSSIWVLYLASLIIAVLAFVPVVLMTEAPLEKSGPRRCFSACAAASERL